jgi:SAM-dependent methyltransferase
VFGGGLAAREDRPVDGDGDALQAGADRFRGFADLYDGVRPVPPPALAELLVDYCGRRPRLVVDLGSGTGLSTRWAATWADHIVGVEPSDDMRAAARRQSTANVSYVAGWSHDTGLAASGADVVVAVQALHWMEPEPTFREVARILGPGGVLAAIDCDWPPVVGDHVAERAWDACRRHIRVFESRLAAGVTGAALRAPVGDQDREAANCSGIDAHRDRRLPEGVTSWSKSGHLDRMSRSGLFTWCREVAMASADEGDADRFIGLLKSQGDYQALRRHHLDDADLAIDRFEATARTQLGPQPRPWHFIYRARLAFAPA